MTTRNFQIKNLAGYVVPVIIVVVAYMAFRMVGQDEPVARREIKQVQQELVVAPVVVHQDLLLLEADGVVVPYREIQLATEVGGPCDAERWPALVPARRPNTIPADKPEPPG